MSAIYIEIKEYENNWYFTDTHKKKREKEAYRWPKINQNQVIVTTTRNQFISMLN